MRTQLVVIKDFEQPENCWECPILKENGGIVYCGLIGERKGKITHYENDFIHKDCKLETLTFNVSANRTQDD